MFSLIPDELINIILLKLEFKDLITISSANKNILKLINEEFWDTKYERNYLRLGNERHKLLERLYVASWKELYYRASNVNKCHPILQYDLTEHDIDKFYDNIPIFKSKDPKLFIDDFINLINGDCYCIILKREEEIPLFNIFSTERRYTRINDYGVGIKNFIKNNLLIVMKTLEVGESLIIYMNKYCSWGQILTRNKDDYEISFAKEDDEPF